LQRLIQQSGKQGQNERTPYADNAVEAVRRLDDNAVALLLDPRRIAWPERQTRAGLGISADDNS
jgi:hypothetical protein